jgi:hypothetical protein
MTSRKLLIDNVKALKSLIDEENGESVPLLGGAGYGIPILTGGASYGFSGAGLVSGGAKKRKSKKRAAPKLRVSMKKSVGGARLKPRKRPLSEYNKFMKVALKQLRPAVARGEISQQEAMAIAASNWSGKGGARRRKGGVIYG